MEVLSKIKANQITAMFEKSSDNNATSDDIIALKKEVCLTIDGVVTLKIGIKNKIDILLKSARDMAKKMTTRKSMVPTSTIESIRQDKQRSTWSSTSATTDGNSDVDDETDIERHREVVTKAIVQALKNTKNFVHGVEHARLAAKDFKIIFDKTAEDGQITCLVECLCGLRVKLFMRADKFQGSNFSKHIKVHASQSQYTNAGDKDDNTVSSDTEIASEESDDEGSDSEGDASLEKSPTQ